MAETTIEWTRGPNGEQGFTFNPWIGCTKVSTAKTGGGGCDGCYAEQSTPVRVMRSRGVETWGAHALRQRTSESNWREPLKWNARAQREGRRFRVFCASLADVFDNQVPHHWRWDLFRLIAATPHLDWLLLTKRIGNARDMLNEAAAAAAGEFVGAAEWDRSPWPHVWLGATVVNQAEADRDIPKLLATPAHVRFLSIEPMLGPVEFSSVGKRSDAVAQLGKKALSGIDWVIAGGESGPDARPLHVDWVRSIVQQCRAASVPVLVKQLGREVHDSGMSSPGEHWPPSTERCPMPRVRADEPAFRIWLKQTKGNDPAEWPEDLRIREVP